jgi:cytochrome c peroxidase
VACHAAPFFTYFLFHNTFATQEEYDSIHGNGAFAQLAIPSLKERKKNYDAYLQPTPRHPNASGRFVAVPSADSPGYVDLGLWNVFGNSDVAKPQLILRLMHVNDDNKSFENLLPQMLARFKTPGLRDLGHSAPYLHTGRMDTIEDVVKFYQRFSATARIGTVRNAAPELQNIALTDADIAPLAAFLRALNEDYN